jgi:S-formylglutathione hydrolase FrmB
MARSSIKKAVDELGSRAPVVLFANGGNHSYYHDRRDGRWGSYILREAIPAAVHKYHLDGRRVAIGGFSMGGFGALDLARFRRFCAVGGHSAAMWRTGGETPQGGVWIDVGTEDPFRSADTELAGLLPQPRFRLWRGGHELKYFDDHATEILRFYASALRDC